MPPDTTPTQTDARAMQVTALATPLGRVVLHWLGERREGVLARVVLAAEGTQAPPAPGWLADAFAAYFRDPGYVIRLPTRESGTGFQRRVWHAIAAIAPGATRTYGELAAELGSSARAIGGACRANPCPLVVPCHRVVARRGLGGFAGDRDGRLLAIKRWLVAHESRVACR